MTFTCHQASETELGRIWAKNIANNPDDLRWVRWRDQYMAYNRTGMAHTFVVCADGDPVGEGTLILSPECGAISGRLQLANGGRIANVNALRIEKAYEGQGHISHLVRQMEEHARTMGCDVLTIGVDAKETRNLAIYLHWGYTQFVTSEDDEGDLVLYYAKML